jgi:hypothetical protein
LSTKGSTNLFKLQKKVLPLNSGDRHSSESIREQLNIISVGSLRRIFQVCQGESSEPYYCHQAEKWTTFKIFTCHQEGETQKLHSDPTFTAKKLKQLIPELEDVKV